MDVFKYICKLKLGIKSQKKYILMDLKAVSRVTPIHKGLSKKHEPTCLPEKSNSLCSILLAVKASKYGRCAKKD